MASAILDQLETYGPQHCQRLGYDQAVAYTRDLARSHYENFTVVSWLLPRPLREDFRHIYAFCRWADDLGDETGDSHRSLELLDWWRRELEACYAGKPRHPVFVALLPTIRRHDIPREPFDHLIDAFIQDQHVKCYETWEQVLDYCRRSADPVGRLVLYVCGYRDGKRQRLGDLTCTALQLSNLWQDVRRDVLERDRVYIPGEVAVRHGLDIDLMVEAIRHDAAIKGETTVCCDARRVRSIAMGALLPAYRSTIRELVDRTRLLFAEGRALWPLLAPDVRLDIKLFARGGETILRMIERQNYNTLERRPSLGSGARFALLLQGLAGKIFGWKDGR